MNHKAHILIVDDEPSIRLFLGEDLVQAGYEVTTAASGEEALARLQEEPIDLILLDLKMQGMSGLEVMAEVERQPLSPVVIMLTAHASLDSAVEAMRHGGHDYLVKPCRTAELLASVEKGLAHRRQLLEQQEILRQIELGVRRLQNGVPAESAETPEASSQPRFLEARGLLLDRKQAEVACYGQPVHLTPSEFRLLQCLMECVGQVVTYRQLMEALHGAEGEKWEARQAVSTHLWNLRNKIGDDAEGRPYLENVRGRGYRFIDA